MTEEQYRQICADCDKLLLAPDAALERVAIPWLHVLNEHPSNVAQYDDVLERPAGSRLTPLRSAWTQARAWWRARGAAPSGDQERRVHVLYVSHLLNEGQVAAAQDFYFGTLPETLAEQGTPGMVLLRNATRLDESTLAKRWPSDRAPRAFLPMGMGAGPELSIRRHLAREARRLRAAADVASAPLQRAVATRAAHAALTTSAIATTRFYHQMVELVRRVRPRAVVVTYEGHAWERLVFAAARDVDASIRCVGYHHTILFPRQHAALRLLGSRYDPDVVLTAGDIAAEQFRQAFGARVAVAILGTHRRQTTPASTAKGDYCLVLPDGIESEVVRLCDFAIACAHRSPRLRFLVRLHPVVSLSALKKRFPRYQSLPANLAFSTEPIEADFARSRWALYRGSNAAIHAVIAGLRPFYVDRPGELRIDSLNGLSAWKRVVLDAEEFVKQVEKDMRGDSDDATDAVAAADYCGRYFMPVSPGVLLDAVRS